MLPIDKVIANMEKNWNEGYVQKQADLIRRTQVVAKERLPKTADADRQRCDRRAKASPLPLGNRVLLKNCAFMPTGRHKLVIRYGDQRYVVVCANDD